VTLRQGQFDAVPRAETMQYGVEEGARGGFERVDALLNRLMETR
jgi:hypothetical protein